MMRVVSSHALVRMKPVETITAEAALGHVYAQFMRRAANVCNFEVAFRQDRTRSRSQGLFQLTADGIGPAPVPNRTGEYGCRVETLGEGRADRPYGAPVVGRHVQGRGRPPSPLCDGSGAHPYPCPPFPLPRVTAPTLAARSAFELAQEA
eukprot:357240-Chlamydomonas_euryale.AAC.9